MGKGFIDHEKKKKKKKTSFEAAIAILIAAQKKKKKSSNIAESSFIGLLSSILKTKNLMASCRKIFTNVQTGFTYMYILYLGIMTVLSLQSFVRDADASHRIKKKRSHRVQKPPKKKKNLRFRGTNPASRVYLW